MPKVQPTDDFVTFDDAVECMKQNPDSARNFVSSLWKFRRNRDDIDENAEILFTSVSSEAPDDPSPGDVWRALKTLQSFAAKNLFGVAAMDALMKLEICLTDAKLDGIFYV